MAERAELHLMICVRMDWDSCESEWLCGTCGRRIQVTFPDLKPLAVLESGNPTPVHHGIGLGVVTSTHVDAVPLSPGAVSAEDRFWLADAGIDWEGVMSDESGDPPPEEAEGA